MNAKTPRPSKSEHEEALLDDALKQTFPASDPPAQVGPTGGITGYDDEHSEDAPKRKPAGKPKRRVAASA